MEKGATTTTKLLYLRGFYAFYFSSMVLRLVYSPVYFKQLGLSSTYTGILNGAGPLVNAFGGLLLCYIADKTNTRKTIFLVSLLACLAIPLLLTFPQTPCLEAGYDKVTMKNMSTGKRKLDDLTGNAQEIVTMRSRNSSSQNSDLGHNQLGVKSLQLQNTGATTSQKKSKSPKPRTRYQYQLLLPNTYWKTMRENTKKRRLVSYDETQMDSENEQQFNAKKKVKITAFTPTKRDHGKGESVVDINNKTNLFLILLTITVVGQFIASPSRNLADTATMFSLEHDKANYGKIRLWGNVGQCLIIPSVSLLVYFKKKTVCDIQQDDYKLALYVLAGMSAIAFVLGFKFVFPPTNQSTGHQAETGTKDQGTVGELVVPLANWSFLIIVLFLGTFEGVFNTFMFWFIVDLNQNQSALIVAVATFLRNVTAFVTFAASPTVLRKFGAINAINISLVLYCGSFSVYSIMANPWIAIIPEVVQYISFSLSMAASVTYMGEIAPDNLAATAQGIVQFMYSGFGQGVGPILAGLVMEEIGNRYTFLVFAAISLLVLGFSVSVQLILKKREMKQYQEVSTDEDMK